MSARAVVIGASGLVGGALMRALGDGAIGTYRTRPRPGLRPLDARDRGAVVGLLRGSAADLMFFPAAEPDVEWCEKEPEAARDRNVAPALSALAAARSCGAAFVFFSSDYVFDGTGGPYDESAQPRPISVYGQLKLEVEERVLAAGGTVIRTTTVFGPEPAPGKNFALRLVARLRAGERVSVPLDQISTPTWTDDLARGSIAVARDAGIWNVAGPDLVSRDELARRIARVFALDGSLIDPVPTSALRQSAPRPLRAGLETGKIAERLAQPLTPLDEALDRFKEQVGG